MEDTIDSLRIENADLKEDLDFYKSRSERYFENYTKVCEYRAQIGYGAQGLAEIYWETEVAKLKDRVAELELELTKLPYENGTKQV